MASFIGREDNSIQRAPITGGGAETVVATSAVPLDLAGRNHTLYWVGDDGLWMAPTSCQGCGPADSTQFWSSAGSILAVDTGGQTSAQHTVYLVDENPQPDPDRILVVDLLDTGGTAFVFATGLLSADIKALTVGRGDTGSISEPTYVYWIEVISGGDSVLRRQALGDDTPEFLWTASTGDADALGNQVIVHDSGVFFADETLWVDRILRLPAEAAGLVLERDVAAAGMEVTQAIQSLENDVPLIAGKPTFVRFYGVQHSGILQIPVEAWLEGYDASGAPLPGSPLQPIFTPPALVTGAPINRANNHAADFKTRSDWTFELPASWYKERESISLKGVIDPRQTVSDPDRSNNEWTGAYPLQSDLTPICLYVHSVETEAPLVTDGADFRNAIAQFKSLWPLSAVRGLWVSEPLSKSEWCWDWDLTCSEPFDLSKGADIQALFDTLRSEPMVLSADTCHPFGYRIFHLGLVHQDAATLDAVLGAAQNGVAWLKVGPDLGGVELAHELGHILGFEHLGCTGQETDHGTLEPDGYYYEDKCVLDDGDFYVPSTHFGFDSLSRRVRSPKGNSDFMSYGQPAWVSDITYNRLIRELGGVAPQFASAQADLARVTSTESPPAQSLSAQSTTGATLAIKGSYDTATNVGRLGYASLLAPGSISPTGSADPSHPERASCSPSSADALGDLIAAYDVVLEPADDFVSSRLTFIHTFPLPSEPVGLIELLLNGQVVAARPVSVNQPAATILNPTPGNILDGPITLRWQATDADGDYLRFSIHYSPDDGQNWLPVVSELYGYPGGDFEYTLVTPQNLAGSDGASGRFRILTSDGYNTDIVEVTSLTVPDRGPSATILAPQPDAWLPAGQAVRVRGAGFDAEDGDLPDAVLNWMLDGAAVGTGSQLSLQGLAPGEYELILDVSDSAGHHAQAAGAFDIRPVGLPLTGQSLTLDGRCHEGAYLAAQSLSLSPYPDGGQATARLLVKEGFLWVCASGLARGDGDLTSTFYAPIDSDLSGGAGVGAGDAIYTLSEDGTPQVLIGDGAGGISQIALGDFSARSAATSETWSAELRIPLSSNSLGLALLHDSFDANGNSVGWPYAALPHGPATWAAAGIGATPFIEALEPDRADEGQPGMDIHILGSGFGADPSVYWNGEAQDVLDADDTSITIHMDADAFAAAGFATVTVESGFVSNPVQFEIVAPPPEQPEPEPCELYPIAVPLDAVQNAVPGMRLSLSRGDQPGNYGWLTWTGSNSARVLAQSLTPSGDSDTYVNPNDADDRTLSHGDWVQGLPGVANSAKVRAALDALLGVPITVPVWNQAQVGGDSARYQVTDFAQISLTDYHLPGAGSMSAIYLNSAVCEE